MSKLSLLFVFTISVWSFMGHSYAAENEILSIDRAVASNLHLSFPNDNNIQPSRSDFEIINYVLMSSESGERWVTITLKNTSSGVRSLEQEHIMGLFANGDRKSPENYPLSFKGKEMQTFTVSFGESKFPILAVYTYLMMD
jgi:hypothetical protein